MRNSNATVVGLFVLLLATALVETSARLEAQSASPSAVTFTRDIAPIVQRACQNCHRPGGGAPMSLITYEDVRPWARAIKQKTVTREMPPWFIDHTIGIQKFKNDPSLTDDEISLISHWADAGAPMGDPAHMPPPGTFRRLKSGASERPTLWCHHRRPPWRGLRQIGTEIQELSRWILPRTDMSRRSKLGKSEPSTKVFSPLLGGPAISISSSCIMRTSP